MLNSVFNLTGGTLDLKYADMQESNEYTADGNSDGIINFSGLKYNTQYNLKELIQPNGYYLYDKDIKL